MKKFPALIFLLTGIGIKVYTMLMCKGNPQRIADCINHRKNVREDQHEMPPQDYQPEEAHIAVVEYILTLKK
jgi:hypothetical protein